MPPPGATPPPKDCQELQKVIEEACGGCPLLFCIIPIPGVGMGRPISLSNKAGTHANLATLRWWATLCQQVEALVPPSTAILPYIGVGARAHMATMLQWCNNGGHGMYDRRKSQGTYCPNAQVRLREIDQANGKTIFDVQSEEICRHFDGKHVVRKR